MREVCRAALDRPILDRGRDARSDVEIELFSVAHGGVELRVRVTRQLVAHLSHAKVLMPKISEMRGVLPLLEKAGGVRTSRSVISLMIPARGEAVDADMVVVTLRGE
jgi:hypothetical protein